MDELKYPDIVPSYDMSVERFELDIDGLGMVGIRHKVENATACLITCHGFAANKDSKKYLGMAETCNRKGMDLVRFDFRGCGESGGEFRDSQVTRRLEDVGAVTDHVEGLGYRSIGLFGSSLGGYVALIKASIDPRIKATVCIASPYSMGNLIEKRLRAGETLEENGIDQEYVVDLKEHDAYMLEAFLDINVPTLIIHGKDDTIVPADHARYIFKRIRSPVKEIEIIKDGDHVFSEPSHLRRVLDMAGQWFKDHLSKD